MSQNNVDVVRRFEELMAVEEGADEGAAFAQSRVERAMELLDEAVAFRPFPGMPGHGGDWIGRDGFLEMCKAYGTAWEAARNVTFQYLDAGDDKVVILLSFDSTSKVTGRMVPVQMVEVITLRDGRILELVPYYYDGYCIVETAGGPKRRAMF